MYYDPSYNERRPENGICVSERQTFRYYEKTESHSGISVYIMNVRKAQNGLADNRTTFTEQERGAAMDSKKKELSINEIGKGQRRRQ